MEETLQLYLVAPKGYEHMTVVMVAPSREVVEQKAYSRPELAGMDVELTILNITTGMAMQGYNIDVSRVSTFH